MRIFLLYAPTLRQLEQRQMWTIHDHNSNVSTIFLEIIKKFNNSMTYFPYSGSILWHQIQAIISLLYSKSSQKFLSKGLEIS